MGPNGTAGIARIPKYKVRSLDVDQIKILRVEMDRLLPPDAPGGLPIDDVERKLARRVVAYMSSVMNGDMPVHTRAIQQAVMDHNYELAAQSWLPAVRSLLTMMVGFQLLRREDGHYSRP